VRLAVNCAGAGLCIGAVYLGIDGHVGLGIILAVAALTLAFVK